MEFRFDESKNSHLIRTRRVSFEEVIEAVTTGALLKVFENPNQETYPGQLIMVVRIRAYTYCVPVDARGNVYFLRTAYPCRKFKYLLGGENDGG